MKLAWVIICIFALAGTSFLPAQTALPGCLKQTLPACCQHHCNMPCCSAKPSPNSQPTSAVPAQIGGQNQFSLLAVSILAWIQPEATVSPVSSDFPTSFVTKGSPLYARNCAWLI